MTTLADISTQLAAIMQLLADVTAQVAALRAEGSLDFRQSANSEFLMLI